MSTANQRKFCVVRDDIRIEPYNEQFACFAQGKVLGGVCEKVDLVVEILELLVEAGAVDDALQAACRALAISDISQDQTAEQTGTTKLSAAQPSSSTGRKRGPTSASVPVNTALHVRVSDLITKLNEMLLECFDPVNMFFYDKNE